MKTRIFQRRPSLSSAFVAVILTLGACAAISAQDKKSVGADFGAREPRTCDDVKAGGALTPELAAQVFICDQEAVKYNSLFLVENVKVQIGAGRPYNAATESRITDLDVNAPVYPIRGSFVKYVCDYLNTGSGSGNNVGKNCNAYKNPKAAGICVKSAFGNWGCSMSDPAAHNEENKMREVAPPAKTDKKDD